MKETKTESKNIPAVTVRPSSGIADALDYEIVSDRKVNLTISRAYAFLELATFEGERSVNERHVQRLYNAFSSGRFMWEHVIIATCQCNGTLYRVNGQHTCWMRVNAPEDADAPVREITYKVDDQHGLREVYATFDQNKSRTPNHIAKTLIIGSRAYSDLWPSKVGEMASALRFWLYPQESLTVSVNDVVSLITGQYADLFKQVGLFWQSKFDVCKSTRRKPVLSAMYATFDAAPNKSIEFWSAVCDAIGFDSKEDPRWHLRRYLDEHSESRRAGVKIVGPEEFYRVCIVAWNKWRKGEKVQSLRPNDRRLKPV